MRRNSYAALPALKFSIGLLVFAFLLFNIERQVHFMFENLLVKAEVLAQQVFLTREWVTDYGGVWVSRDTPPYHRVENNMYLKTPAMVTGELARYADKYGRFAFGLASRNPLNPDNTPDALELEAISRLEQGERLFTRLVLRPTTQFHYVVPLHTDERCLECHYQQGYAEGDLAGVLSVTIPAGTMLQQLYVVTATNVVFALVTFALATLLASDWVKKSFYCRWQT
ncbi:MAG: DUF3365 domain-containing protein [Dethiobacter sp.]|nr:DUF3365 domain-containing protein [Dethiobacter sp.]MCL5981287.1 DUF3365 domain-containing protein [Bacillota bacterium]